MSAITPLPGLFAVADPTVPYRELPRDLGLAYCETLLTTKAPAWSPFAIAPELPGDLNLLFPRSYFAEFFLIRLSPTRLREFNTLWKRRYERSQIGEWAPPGPFTSEDIPHLIACAARAGAYALIDFGELISAAHHVAAELYSAGTKYRGVIRPHEGLTDLQTSFVGLTLEFGFSAYTGEPILSLFFMMLQAPTIANTPFGQKTFSYLVDGIGEEVLQQEARRYLGSSRLTSRNAARAYLHMPVADDPDQTLERFLGLPLRPSAPRPAARPAAAPVPDNLADIVKAEKTDERLPSWLPPPTPEGVILTRRAQRELKAARGYSEEKLQAGFACLAAYRSLKMGSISLEAYNETVAAARFTDSRCFADSGSLKTFADDYSVNHDGARYILDRHLKWGRGTSVRTCLRLYYAWDADLQLVIVGSAPRHLPVWQTN